MNADEFRDYILGFIFYKYLSEKMEIFANVILKQDKIKFREINPKVADAKEYIEAIKEEALEKLGCFLKSVKSVASIFFMLKVPVASQQPLMRCFLPFFLSFISLI